MAIFTKFNGPFALLINSYKTMTNPIFLSEVILIPLCISNKYKLSNHLFSWEICSSILLHFVAFFHVASLFSAGVDNKKVGVDNEKALELTNSTVFHRGRQWKSSRAGQQNIFFIFQPDFNIEISPKNATKHPVA